MFKVTFQVLIYDDEPEDEMSLQLVLRVIWLKLMQNNVK